MVCMRRSSGWSARRARTSVRMQRLLGTWRRHALSRYLYIERLRDEPEHVRRLEVRGMRGERRAVVRLQHRRMRFGDEPDRTGDGDVGVRERLEEEIAG